MSSKNFKGWEGFQYKPIVPQTPQQRTQALGRLPGGEMNKTEAAYNRLLETRLGVGDIRWFKFEPINIRSGAKCFYSVDFMVMLADGTIEAHEVKGTVSYTHLFAAGLRKFRPFFGLRIGLPQNT